MIESFVDLTYRGLPLGRRVKLTQVRPTTGYLELPTPMPVGTLVAIVTDEGVTFDAKVTDIHEQVGGNDRAPGMTIAPVFGGDRIGSWWQARVALPELPPKSIPVTVVAAVPAPPILPRARRTAEMPGVPESRADTVEIAMSRTDTVQDAPRPTVAMEAVDPDHESVPVIVDDGKKTIVMTAIDISALGLNTGNSGEMPAVDADDDGDDDDGDKSDGNGDKSDGTGTRPDANGDDKKRRRRRGKRR